MPCKQRCTAPLWSFTSQKSCRPGASRYFATCTAWSISSSIPSFFAAEIGTTGMPSISSISFTRTEPPFWRTSSIILSASTIGTSSSISCIVRYKLRSMFVASTMLMMPRGCSSKTKRRVTSSSLEYGDME